VSARALPQGPQGQVRSSRLVELRSQPVAKRSKIRLCWSEWQDFEPATPWSRTRCATKASFRDRPVRRRGLRFWSRRTKRSTRFSWPDRVSSRTGESLCHRATTAHGVVRDLHLHRRFGHSRKREIRAEYVNQGDHFARSLDCAGMNGPKTSGEARASEEEAVVTAAPAVCQPLARPLGSIDIRDPAIY